jgi:hypothetical protein
MPQLLKHNTYRTFSLDILVLFFDIKLPATLSARSEVQTLQESSGNRVPFE